MITKEMIKNTIDKVTKENHKECINIKMSLDSNLGLFDSKFGGLPYLPKDYPVPTDSENEQLALLAQIKCEDLPENNIYPQRGLLQFWIGRDDLLGLPSDGTGNDYRVIYFENINDTVTKEEVLLKYRIFDENNQDEYSPFMPKNSSYSLTFEKDTTTITSTDYKFEPIFIKSFNDLYPEEEVTDFYEDFSDEFLDLIYDSFEGLNHAIGGYPTFTQWDPRENLDSNYDIMLLQIESEWSREDQMYGTMWGDAGVANFFINEEDLKNKKFDNTLFNWDCT